HVTGVQTCALPIYVAVQLPTARGDEFVAVLQEGQRAVEGLGMGNRLHARTPFFYGWQQAGRCRAGLMILEASVDGKVRFISAGAWACRYRRPGQSRSPGPGPGAESPRCGRTPPRSAGPALRRSEQCPRSAPGRWGPGPAA